MNNEFIHKMMKPAVYELKAGTKCSYAYVSGHKILPKTISIFRESDAIKIARSGRGLLPKVGQMKSSFTKAESSPYKQNKPYKVHTSIWQIEGYKTLFYGTIGLTGTSGRIEADNGDLILFSTSDWEKVYITIFVGLVDSLRLPEVLAQAAECLQSYLNS